MASKMRPESFSVLVVDDERNIRRTLELVLGPKPNFNWGVAQPPPSESPPALPVRVTPPSPFTHR